MIDNLFMASLTKGLGTETYDDPQFAGSGPIDCVYVAGKETGNFTLAAKSLQTFGSDHFAVSTRLLLPAAPAGPAVRIVALLPNPDGADPGHEWVELKNVSGDSVNLNGWKLRDEANNDFALSGTIGAGAVMRVELPAGQLPLNNGGDEIELLTPSGETAHFVSYSGQQVSSGVAIQFPE